MTSKLRFLGWFSVLGLALALTAACDTEDPCKSKPDCAGIGKCTSGENGVCVAAKAEDCAGSKACTEDGKCTAADGQCLVGSDADCAGSEACKKLGNCNAYAGMCQDLKKIVQGECAKTCAKEGLCVMVDGKCKALSRRHCAGTFDDKPEKDSPCGRLGYCTAQAGECVAGSSEDCAVSTACKEASQCEEKNGKCVATADGCKASETCSRSGRCGEKDGECVAVNNKDCQDSLQCKLEGTCSAKDGACIAASSADCQRSSNCKKVHYCTAKDGVCVSSGVGELGGTEQRPHKEINTKLGGLFGLAE